MQMYEHALQCCSVEFTQRLESVRGQRQDSSYKGAHAYIRVFQACE
jgi:hypothetical protein